MWTSPARRVRRPWCWLILVGANLVAGDEKPVRAPVDDAYIQQIQKAHADLNAGRPGVARETLEATPLKLRRFEFDYLSARAAQAGVEAKPAPTLVASVPKPVVENRYAVLGPERTVVFLCRDGSLRIHDLAKPQEEPQIVKHPDQSVCWSGAFSRDGKTFVSGHENGEVLVWDTAAWTLRQRVSLGAAWPVRELAVAPDGKAFVGETQMQLELWTLADEKPARVAGVGERYNFGEGLAFSPKGDLVATGGMFDILLHDAKTGALVRTMRHASYTMGLAFNDDGTQIASAPRGNVNKFLAVLDVKEGAIVFNAGPYPNYITGTAFSPDGARIAATGCENMLRLVDAATGKTVLALDRPECGAKPAFTRDGRLMGWNEPGGYVYIDLGPLEEPVP